MTNSFSAYWRGLAGGIRTEPGDRFVILLMAPFSLIYSFVQRLRTLFYKFGLLKSQRLPRPVISIGNITVGGTGKTPVTAYIARHLLQEYRVAVLSRGYGGSLEGQTVVVSDGATVMLGPRECGDEPYLLASTIPGLIVVIGADRYAAGLLAMQQFAPDVFLLDDGFQHLRLHRDLNILLLDHSYPYGNGWTLPAGLLREPVSAGKRADLVIHTRCPADCTDAVIVSGKPSCVSRHELADGIPLLEKKPFALAGLRGKKLLAFAGIADPLAFFRELRSHGLDVVTEIALPDHVAYDTNQIKTVADAFRASGADYAITTEKDGVKLTCLPPELAHKTLLARLSLTMIDPAPLKALLRNLLQK